MINTLASYAEAGCKAGEASKQQDWPRAQSWLDWHRRAVQLEHTEQDKTAARDGFRDGISASGQGLAFSTARDEEQQEQLASKHEEPVKFGSYEDATRGE